MKLKIQLLAEKKKNVKMSKAYKCAIYGAVQRWFAKHKNGDFNLRNTPRFGHSVKFNEEFSEGFPKKKQSSNNLGIGT